MRQTHVPSVFDNTSIFYNHEKGLSVCQFDWFDFTHSANAFRLPAKYQRQGRTAISPPALLLAIKTEFHEIFSSRAEFDEICVHDCLKLWRDLGRKCWFNKRHPRYLAEAVGMLQRLMPGC